MTKQITQVILFLYLIPCSLFAQKGIISGKIIDKANGEGLIGVTVKAECGEVATGAITDIEGKFQISVVPNTYKLSVHYASYQPGTMDVVVKANEISYADFTMEEANNNLKEVVISYTVEKSSSLSLLTERKNTALVSDGVSAELIRRTPDRTTSDVLKRVTGASIQEGKFAVIRGMNDRYNAGYLDGAPLPSTESDRKAFAFDVVPANLIDNLTIIKAGSPDLVGDFGGGIIKINTKAVPEKFTQSISIGGQTHSLTTFKGFTQFKRYSGEALNFLNKARNLPEFDDNALRSASLFPSAEEKTKFAAVSKNFNNDWSNSTITAPVNTRFNYSLGFPVRLSDTRKIGVIMALNYANTRRFSQGSINTFDGSGQVAALSDNIFLNNISSGGLFNVNYVATKTQINFRNLINLNTDNNTIQRTGTGNIQDAVQVRNMANLVNYNRLLNHIVTLKQVVGENLFSINASVNYSNVRRRIPDYRIVNYTITPDFENYQLTLGDFFNSSTGRFSSDLKESLFGGNVELVKGFDTRKVKTDIKIGAFYQGRNRSFAGRSFVYNGAQPSALSYDPATDLSVANIDGRRLYLVEKTADDLGYYNGKSSLSAAFAAADQKIGKLRAVYGVRYEDVDIDVTNEKIGANVARIQQGVALPSVNLSYSLTEKANVRAAYYATVNRPEFRELAPFAFYVFDKNAEIRGNKNLQIARLNNYDLRLELFPSGSQVISIGGFYKSIQNPVEFSLDVTQTTTTFTYENEKSARIYGVELEFRKKLDFLGKADFLSDLVIFSNLALIKSRLTFDEGTLSRQNRPLQGQSPYVLNAGLQYENQDNGWFASVVFNRIGRRLAYAGVDPKFGDTRQDIYEAPRSVLDFQVGKNIGRFNLKLTLGDILAQKLNYYQDVNDNKKYDETGANKDRLMFQFKNGFTTSLTVGYTF
jgi:TonB-dependent receptor